MEKILKEINEECTITPKQIEDRNNVSILMEYELDELKESSFILLNINVPEDILLESDIDYIKANISKIILHYLHKIWNNEIIKLEDKFYKCKSCNNWSYLKSKLWNICIICFDKRKAKPLERELWN